MSCPWIPTLLRAQWLTDHSEVYTARDSRTRQLVALKRIIPLKEADGVRTFTQAESSDIMLINLVPHHLTQRDQDSEGPPAPEHPPAHGLGNRASRKYDCYGKSEHSTAANIWKTPASDQPSIW